MPGIDRAVIEHKLNVHPTHKPQKKQHMLPQWAAAATAEVKRLLKAGFNRECQYPKWISNVILVKKANGT